MNLEELQKFLDDNKITLEEYLRENMITDEDRKYVDNIWMRFIRTLVRTLEQLAQGHPTGALFGL